MKLFESQSIRRQILAVMLVIAVPLVVAISWDASRTRQERTEEITSQASVIVTTVAGAIDQFFAGLDSVSSILVRHPAVLSLSEQESNRLFAELLRDQPLILNVSLRDRSGIVRAAGAGLVDGRARQTPVPPHAREVLATGHAVVSDLQVGQLSGKQTVVQAYPVRAADGSVIGVLSFGLNLSEFQQVFKNIPLPEGSIVTLVDRRSRVLVRSSESERYIGTPFDTGPVEPDQVPRTFTRTGTDGVRRLHANIVVSRGPWLLSIGIPESTVLAEITPLWRRDLVVGLSALGGLLVLVLWLTHLTTRGMTSVRLAAQKIASGDLSPPASDIAPNLEIAQLQEAFRQMAVNLRNMRDALDQEVEEERRMREMLQSLQRQVVRQERLAAVGQLVSGVAHELNNPLQAILGAAELVERRPGLAPDVMEDVRLLKAQSTRAREIIRKLSRFGSQQPAPPAFVDLAEVITEVVQLRQHDLDRTNIDLSIDVSSSKKVYANFTELEQVLLNFLINAQQAIESTGRPSGRILVSVADLGKRIRLEVHDDGPGVSPDSEPKLFQPFFTTKPVGKGTGLGLSVSYGIINSYGGAIGHTANPWGGATFFFELPVAEVRASA